VIKVTLAPGANKRIFISDIHMGDQRSTQGSPPHSHPYGWLQSHITSLAKFLTEKLNAQDVGRVVILGDLFDQWVIPTDLDPIPRLDDICNNPANEHIIDNLKALAESSKLSYVPGNHDMGACPGDIRDMKKFIVDTFPGIDFICEDAQPTGVYREGKLVAEHGNMYCLFNAPDSWTDPHSFLPLGYFISRMVAYKVAQEGRRENYLDILCKFIPEYESRHDFINKLILAVAVYAKLKRTDKIDMKNINGFGPSITIDEVADKYRQLIDDWNTHNKIDYTDAIKGDCLDLLWAACKVYLDPGTDTNTNIVIFGHTHAWKNGDPYLSLVENEQKSGPPFSPHPCKAIYANTGTWIDSKPCTYVETEANGESQRHYVRVMSYPGNKVLRETYITL
jgi:UDP-2,3-diacylglucosamine pyrophosphatase LpxH